jgi:hypothetical protein
MAEAGLQSHTLGAYAADLRNIVNFVKFPPEAEGSACGDYGVFKLYPAYFHL